MNYLLDTCVISELRAKQPNPKVIEWIDSIDGSCLFLSAITIGEIQRGIAKLSDSSRRQKLEHWLEEELLKRFDGQILLLTTDVMREWGNLTARGRTLPAVDSMIAALALYHNLCLVTRNVRDFEDTNVTILNPWKS